MVATPGTIPALTQYQPDALPVVGTEAVEIVNTTNATAAASYFMLLTDIVGKMPSVIAQATPTANDRFAFTQMSTALPKSCTLGNLGVPFGNVATGGSTGQIYNKNSGTNFDAGWSSITSFVGAGTSLATTGSATAIVINVAAGGIGSTQLGANAVLRANMTAFAIGSGQIDTSAVQRANMTAFAIGSAQIDTAAIQSAQLDAFAVVRGAINTSAVGSAQIDVFAVGSTQIATAAVSLQTSVIGTLPVANGGSGTTSLTANGVLIGNGASAFTVTAAGGTGTVLLANNGTPSFSPFLKTLGFTVTTATFGVLSSTTLVNITSLSAALAATSTYFFKANLYVTAGSTGGSKVAIAMSASPASIVYEAYGHSAGTLAGEGRSTTSAGAIVIATAAVVPTIKIIGTITTNSSGTLTAQIAQVAATTTTTLVLGGSTMEVFQVA